MGKLALLLTIKSMIQIIWMGVRSVLTLPHILPQNSSPLFLHLSSVRRGVGLLRLLCRWYYVGEGRRLWVTEISGSHGTALVPALDHGAV